MKTDISELRSKLIEEARDRMATPPGKDEITASMLGKELECSTKQAYSILENMVTEGLAAVRKNGPRKTNVYKMK